jgi:hypothetical protein
MTDYVTDKYINNSCDCLILVHPSIPILERISNDFQSKGIVSMNISRELSSALMFISTNERSRFVQNWLIDSVSSGKNGPLLCGRPDLLFDPSLKIDPLTLFRQAAKMMKLIVLWPGEYNGSILSYAIPEHHHFRTWKISPSLLQQPAVTIQRISTSQGV